MFRTVPSGRGLVRFLGMTRAKLGFQPLDSGFIVGNMTVTDGAGNTKTLGLRYQDRMSVGGFE